MIDKDKTNSQKAMTLKRQLNAIPNLLLPRSRSFLKAIARDLAPETPTTATIDINTACNLQCNFCWVHSPLATKPCRPQNLPWKTIRKIFDMFEQWGIQQIAISGDGEPTLHPHFREIALYARSRCLHLFLTTNATCPKRLLSTLARFDVLHITLSAADPYSYEKVQSPTNPHAFKRAIRNIKILSAIARKHGRLTIEASYIINTTTFRSLPRMFELAETLDLKKIAFHMMEPTKQTRSLLLSTSEQKELLQIIQPLCRKRVPFLHNLPDILDGLVEHPQSVYHLSGCFIGWYNISIDYNGNVGLCCHNEKLIIGNLKNATLEEIWKSSKAQKLRLLCKYHFDTRRNPFRGECEWCHWSRDNVAITQQLKKLRRA